MPRFFIDDRPQGELYTLTGENAHHAGRVLRLRPGETLTLCDGAGTDFDCTVEQAEKDEQEAAQRRAMSKLSKKKRK